VGQTIVEKILTRVSRKKVTAGDIIYGRPDLIIMYNWPGISDKLFSIIKDELKIKKLVTTEKIILVIDHMVSPSSVKDAEFLKNTRQYALENGIKLIEMQGIGHQVIIEAGIIRPGMFAVHFDTHVPTVGAVGAFGLPLALDLLEALVTGEVWLEVPHTTCFQLTGRLPDGVMGRDLIHKIIHDLGPQGVKNHMMEFSGPGLKYLEMDDRIPVGSQCTWAGALSAVFEVDHVTDVFLKNCGVSDYPILKSDSDAEYKETYLYDLGKLEPYVIAPPLPYKAIPLSEVEGIEINQGYIGSCAGGRLKDIEIAARILKGRKIKEGFRLFVVPSTKNVFKESMQKGLLNVLVEAGAYISSPSCDFCYGRAQCLAEGEKAVSTGTLNVPGRMGSTKAEIYLASSAVVAATALNGKLSDPREFL
jgi:3-isopropylmalate/(R)-2-methylmalate dehydratase large subunit